LLFALISGELPSSIAFCLLNPDGLLYVLLIAALQVLGQISVYYVIANFKQHIYPLISTTRKIVTILVSILAFSHRLNLAQWLSLIMVFAGMGYELYDEIDSQ
jgi:drug/metabolite transporter (DMT)-like permease